MKKNETKKVLAAVLGNRRCFSRLLNGRSWSARLANVTLMASCIQMKSEIEREPNLGWQWLRQVCLQAVLQHMRRKSCQLLFAPPLLSPLSLKKHQSPAGSRHDYCQHKQNYQTLPILFFSSIAQNLEGFQLHPLIFCFHLCRLLLSFFVRFSLGFFLLPFLLRLKPCLLSRPLSIECRLLSFLPLSCLFFLLSLSFLSASALSFSFLSLSFLSAATLSASALSTAFFVAATSSADALSASAFSAAALLASASC